MKRLFILLPVVVLAGCAGIEAVAPVVRPEMVLAAGGGVDIETLQEGRRLLANRCTSCHSLEPVAKHTPSEWVEIVHKMSKRSGLSPEEEKKVAAFLVAARSSL